MATIGILILKQVTLEASHHNNVTIERSYLQIINVRSFSTSLTLHIIHQLLRHNTVSKFKCSNHTNLNAKKAHNLHFMPLNPV